MYDYLQKIRRFGTIQLLAVLCLAILPQVSFGQTPTLDNLHLGSNQPQPQCLDFNQDRVCEFIVLANGTMVDNPINQRPIAASTSQPESSPQQGSGQKLLPGGAYDFPKCLGHISDGCENILLSNGTMIKNPRNQSMTIYVQDYPDSEPTVEQGQGQTVEDEAVYDEEAGSSGGGGGGDNHRDDPDCWFEDLYVCDENGKCDTDRIDCITDCENGSTVTTGEKCPGEDDSDRQTNEDQDDNNNGDDRPDDWDEPRELEDDEEIYVGEATQGYEDEEGTIDE